MNSIKKHFYRFIDIYLIFGCCIFIYLANGRNLGTGDSVPNTLLAFNWLNNHTLQFNNFQGTYLQSVANGYFFTKSINGDLTSVYPIGTAIITFPIYCIFFLYLKACNIPLDITSPNFELYRLLFEKLAATITTSIGVIVFYLSARLKFPIQISIISTFIYAFATNNWMISSQGLWQHGPANLALLATIYCLLKANYQKNKVSKKLLIIAGLFCGLIPGTRPTSAIFSIAAIMYAVFTFKIKSAFFCIGLVSAVPSIVWNWYNFGNFTGGYSNAFHGTVPYIFTLENFIGTSFGLLFSPSRGLIIFSPIVIYALSGAYQVFKRRYYQDEYLIGVMTIAAVCIFINY